MAVDFPTSDLTAQIITKLVSVASEEVILAWRLDDDLTTLRDRTELVDALVSDAQSNSHRTTKTVEVWIRQVTKVVGDASAFLDGLEYRAARRLVEPRSKVRKFLSLFRRFKMAHRIVSINQSMDGIFKSGIEVGLKPRHYIDPDPGTSKERPQMPPTVDESGIQGREDDKTNIIQMLCRTESYEKRMSVVAIVGMPGLGKTTLAQIVYQDAGIRMHFRKTIWITVSRNFNVVDILNLMVESLVQMNLHLTLLESLLQKLKGLLDNSKLLLVLDDVWNENDVEWERMNDCLIGINVQKGSKILVTTRSLRVAGIMQSSIYQLGKLSFKDSWMIFEQKVFCVGRARETKVFTDMGKTMVQKCDGVPLALNVLGGLLQDKKTERQWSLILSHPCWLKLMENHLPILHISFDDLRPSLLKSCFAFCSIFPKNFVFGKHVLIQLWMALNFLSGSNMEDVGKTYFKMLYQKSLFEDWNRFHGTDDRVPHENILCCMHDLVHDLAQEVSKKFCATTEVSKVNDVPPTVVHLRLMGGYIEKIPKSFEKCLGRLQTLYLEVDLCVEIFEGLKALRILILSNRKIKHLPKTIGKLKQLRYIDISETNIETLQNSVFDLYLLQTLRVNCLNNFSKKLKRLAKLRHLYFHDIDRSMGCMFMGISALTELQSLPFFVVSKTQRCLLEELECLNNLNSQLRIYGLEDVNNKDEAEKARLDNKSKVSSLEFHWKKRFGDNEEHIDEDVLEGLKPHSNLKQLLIENFKGKRFASWMMMVNPSLAIFRNLVKLGLFNCPECERVPALGHLHSLEELDIRDLSSVKCIGMEFYGLDGTSCNDGAFPSLRMLDISSLPKLQEWIEVVEWNDLKIFPCLEVLRIEGCPMLKNVPNHFPSLKELYIGEVGVEKWWFNNASVTAVEMRNCSNLMKLKWGVNLDVARYGGVPFHYLRMLSLKGLPKLVEWVDGVGAEVSLSSASASNLWSDIFPSLGSLVIEGCPMLKRGPSHFPSLEWIDIRGVNCGEWLEMMSSNLTSVTELKLSEIGGCEIEHVVEQFLRSNTCLWRLDIGGCTQLRHPPIDLLLSSTSLRELGVQGFDRMDSQPEWLGSLFNLEEPRNLPMDCLQSSTSLLELRVHGFDGMESLPEWLGSLFNLRYLVILSCSNVKELPTQEAMAGLSKLYEMWIEGCPLLEERLREENGPERRKIPPNLHHHSLYTAGMMFLKNM